MKIRLCYFMLVMSILLVPLTAHGAPKVRGEAAVLINGYTGEIIWEKNAQKLRHPASTIKIITCLLALELAEPEEIVQVGKEAAKTYVGQTIGLAEGDMITVADLLAASMLWSANDGAVALGEHLAGNAGTFSLLMSHKAWALGAYQSTFKNANGYSVPGQFSTAYDLALMGRAAMTNKYLARLVKQKEQEIHWLNKKQSKKVINTNKLLDYYEGANGIKTGTTKAAGGCLVASAQKDDLWLIATVLGSSRRYADVATMFDYGFLEMQNRD